MLILVQATVEEPLNNWGISILLQVVSLSVGSENDDLRVKGPRKDKLQTKGWGFLQAFEEASGWALLSRLCDDLNMHTSVFKQLVPTEATQSNLLYQQIF